MNGDQHTQQRFEDRLLAELRRSIVASPSAGRPFAAAGMRRRLALVGGTVAVLAVAAAAGVPFLVDGGTPAYAVSANDDGTVTVEINALSDATGLELKLDEAGIPARVEYLPAGEGCGEGWFTPAETSGGWMSTSTVEVADDGQTTFTIDPGTLGPDETVVIQTQGDGSGPSSVAIAIAQGEVGPCELVAVDAPAGGSVPRGATVHRDTPADPAR